MLRISAAAIVLALCLASGHAAAAEPPAATSATAGAVAPPTEGTPGATGSGLLERPTMLGLIAALFLICGAIVGANDKHHRAKPKSQR